jgi:hypothetical protein
MRSPSFGKICDGCPPCVLNWHGMTHYYYDVMIKLRLTTTQIMYAINYYCTCTCTTPTGACSTCTCATLGIVDTRALNRAWSLPAAAPFIAGFLWYSEVGHFLHVGEPRRWKRRSRFFFPLKLVLIDLENACDVADMINFFFLQTSVDLHIYL